ncbi:MAG: hypothetical protein L0Y54_16890, partial [Sporichthyaceae bacterium]|nr:hypothetical protein [Sporichthyaceae bacterium]
MFRNTRSVVVVLCVALVVVAAAALAKDAIAWRPVADGRALSVRVGDPSPTPVPVTVFTDKCCTPSAFDSCTTEDRFWGCVTVSLINCPAPPSPPNEYTWAKYGDCTHKPGQTDQSNTSSKADCQPPKQAVPVRCTDDPGKPEIKFKVDRCTPTGEKHQSNCLEGLARCKYKHTAAGKDGNTAYVPVKACAAGDTICPLIQDV